LIAQRLGEFLKAVLHLTKHCPSFSAEIYRIGGVPRVPFGHLLPCSNVPRGIVCKVLLTLRGGGAETPKLSWCVADVEVR